MIISCNCRNPGQDDLYGKGCRLANACKPKLLQQGQHWYRCTVCGKEVQKEGKS